MIIHNEHKVFDHVAIMLQYHYSNDPMYDNVVFVLGYNVMRSLDPVRKKYPRKKIIVFQLEQLFEGAIWAKKYLGSVLRTADEVWDYDEENIIFMKQWYKVEAKMHPMLYAPTLKTIKMKPYDQRDIDVLFYGYTFERRAKFLFKLQHELANKWSVYDIYGVFGEPLDDLISRSKIIVNVHSKSIARQEQVRMMYPVVNNCCVVSEKDKRDYMSDSVISIEYDEMAKKIKDLLVSGQWRNQCEIAESRWRSISHFRESKLVSMGMRSPNTKSV